MEQNLSALENLRSEIEREHRFKSALNGYDKTAVKEYLAALMPTFEGAMAELREEVQRLKGENAELQEALAAQQEQLETAKSRERARAEAELSARESLVDSLRAANGRLTEENHAKELEIADLRRTLAERVAAEGDGAAALEALNRHLTGALNSKARECEELIRAWSAEFTGTLAEMTR